MPSGSWWYVSGLPRFFCLPSGHAGLREGSERRKERDPQRGQRGRAARRLQPAQRLHPPPLSSQKNRAGGNEARRDGAAIPTAATPEDFLFRPSHAGCRHAASCAWISPVRSPKGRWARQRPGASSLPDAQTLLVHPPPVFFWCDPSHAAGRKLGPTNGAAGVGSEESASYFSNAPFGPY